MRRRSIQGPGGDARPIPVGLRLWAATATLGAVLFTAGCAGDADGTTAGSASSASPTPREDTASQTQGPDASSALPEDLATATSTLNVPVRPNAVLSGQGLAVQVDDDPPILCLAPYIETYPPDCTGPLLLGLDWEEMPPYSMSQGVRWGQARVVGRLEASTFTLTQPPSPPMFPVEPNQGTGAQSRPTLCADPYADGAGTGMDPLADEAAAARRQALALLETDPDYASSYMSDGSSVLNVLLVSQADAEATRAELREVWGGGLCVQASDVPPREAVYEAMDTMSRANLPNVFSWSAAPDGGIEIEVLLADEDTIILLYSILDTVLDQDDIHITSALTPLDPQPSR